MEELARHLDPPRVPAEMAPPPGVSFLTLRGCLTRRPVPSSPAPREAEIQKDEHSVSRWSSDHGPWWGRQGSRGASYVPPYPGAPANAMHSFGEHLWCLLQKRVHVGGMGEG